MGPRPNWLCLASPTFSFFISGMEVITVFTVGYLGKVSEIVCAAYSVKNGSSS